MHLSRSGIRLTILCSITLIWMLCYATVVGNTWFWGLLAIFVSVTMTAELWHMGTITIKHYKL